MARTPQLCIIFTTLLTSFLFAQQNITNAKLSTQNASPGLSNALHALSKSGVVWIAYAVPLIRDDVNICCSNNGACRRCGLEQERSEFYSSHSHVSAPINIPQKVHLERGKQLLVFLRTNAGHIERIRTFTDDCEVDADNMPVEWLSGVVSADSVATLAAVVRQSAQDVSDDAPWNTRELMDQGLAAIALHADPAADHTLDEFVAPNAPEALRKKTVFWLGNERGRPGYDELKNVVNRDPSDRVREQAVFGLSQSPVPEAVDTMIAVARNDSAREVRGQALFWLAQKAGRKAEAAISSAIGNDPDTEVKEKAVFALSQLPKEEGVPLLIRVAQSNRNPQVRKQAMFWLGQSNDPRALAFFEQVLAR